MPVVDFSTVELTNFEPIPAGTYELLISDAEEKEGNKAPYLNLILEVTDAEDAELVGRKVWDILSFSAASLWRLHQFLLAVGFEEETLQGEVDFDPADLLGYSVTAIVGIEPARDSYPARNRVKRYL